MSMSSGFLLARIGWAGSAPRETAELGTDLVHRSGRETDWGPKNCRIVKGPAATEREDARDMSKLWSRDYVR